MLATILWVPTVYEGGTALGDSRQIEKADIAQAPDEKEGVVSWWRAVHENGERVPGETQSITVSLSEREATSSRGES
jgi:hypothetical protein